MTPPDDTFLFSSSVKTTINWQLQYDSSDDFSVMIRNDELTLSLNTLW